MTTIFRALASHDVLNLWILDTFWHLWKLLSHLNQILDSYCTKYYPHTSDEISSMFTMYTIVCTMYRTSVHNMYMVTVYIWYIHNIVGALICQWPKKIASFIFISQMFSAVKRMVHSWASFCMVLFLLLQGTLMVLKLRINMLFCTYAYLWNH
jgi:hypothetical protein